MKLQVFIKKRNIYKNSSSLSLYENQKIIKDRKWDKLSVGVEMDNRKRKTMVKTEI